MATTSTTAQWSPGATTQASVTQDGLLPGSSYVLLVRAVKKNADGTYGVSDYASIPYTASAKGASGLNQLAINDGTDIQLNGGALYATTTDAPFPPNVGLFNVVTGTTKGTGVILNSTGIAGFKAGVKTFYINAADGTAVFAGSVASNATINGVTASALTTNVAVAITKNQTFVGTTAPTANNVGDMWYDSAHGYKAYRWSGTAWISVQDTAIQSAAQAASDANNAALAAQSSASGKNTIIYGTKGDTTNNGYAPNGTKQTVTSSATGGTPTTDTFANTYSNTSNNIDGDTWFVRNVDGSIIAQYTIVSGTWTRTTVSSQVIGNLDAGKITAGTISSIAYNNGNGTFSVDTYGNLIATSASITGSITVASGTNYWGPTGMSVTTAIGNISMSATSGTGYINLAAGSPTSGIDDTATYSGSSATAYNKTSKIKLSSAGTFIYGMPVQGNYTDYQSVAGGTIAYVITDPNSGNLSYGIGAGARQRMLIEDPYSGLVKLGMAVYYGQRSSAPGGGTGYVGDLWVSW
jgi:hypothetical protein